MSLGLSISPKRGTSISQFGPLCNCSWRELQLARCSKGLQPSWGWAQYYSFIRQPADWMDSSFCTGFMSTEINPLSILYIQTPSYSLYKAFVLYVNCGVIVWGVMSSILLILLLPVSFFSIEKKLSLLLPNSQIIRTAGSFFPPKLFFRKCKARSTVLKAKIAEYYLMNGNEYCKNHKELMAYEIMMRAFHCSLLTLERWAPQSMTNSIVY